MNNRLTLRDVASYENLTAAFFEARRGKSRVAAVSEFWVDYEDNILKLQSDLLSGRWLPSPYRHFTVNDTKPRLISAVPFHDRIVHHAIVRRMEPIFERIFCNRTYACRVGYGTHRAVQRLQQDMQGADYILKCDIRKYFPSISHRVLIKQLNRYNHCKQLRSLIEQIVDSYMSNHHPEPSGLPLGNQTSQFFGNVYLNDFDHFVIRDLGCKRYGRYVDDFALLSDSKDQLHQWHQEVVDYLRLNLQLDLHPSKVFIQPVTVGLDFLGYTVFPAHRRLRPSNGYRFRRRMRTLLRTIPANDEAVRCRIAAWLGHAKHADTYGLRRTVLTELGVIHDE